MPYYGVSVVLDTASPLARAVRRGVDLRTFHEALGQAGRKTVRDHFILKESEMTSASTTMGGRTKLGHVGVFAEFSRAISISSDSGSVTITIAHPAIRQRLLGGVIRPVNAKNLTLPARPEAYGLRASEVRVDLKFGYAYDEELGRWRRALIADTVKSKAKKTGAWFWLVPQVNQKADPSVLPDDQVLMESALQALRGWNEDLENG